MDGPAAMTDLTPEEIPAGWVKAGERGYRMDGNLIRNILAAAAPLIAGAERERIRQLAQERLDALGPDNFSQAAAAYADVLIVTDDDWPTQ
jgi:hypothetical protein